MLAVGALGRAGEAGEHNPRRRECCQAPHARVLPPSLWPRLCPRPSDCTRFPATASLPAQRNPLGILLTYRGDLARSQT